MARGTLHSQRQRPHSKFIALTIGLLATQTEDRSKHRTRPHAHPPSVVREEACSHVLPNPSIQRCQEGSQRTTQHRMGQLRDRFLDAVMGRGTT